MHTAAPLSALTTPDTLVLVACVLFALRGAWKGFAWQAVRTVGLVAALLGAGAWHQRFGVWLDDHVTFLPSAATPWVAWFLILAGLLFVATFFAWMAKGAVHRVELGGVDRLLGFGMGAVMGLVLMTAGFLVWGSWVQEDTLRSTLDGSVSVGWMARVVDTVEPFLPADVAKRWGPVLHTLHGVGGEQPGN
jgi:membrane protein required for colicin V production